MEDLKPMSTAAFPGPTRPVVVFPRKARELPSLSQGRAATTAGDLTIHRITSTHHGRTLLMLGHAAEHLSTTRRFSTEKVNHAANVEAIHILMELSRSVFDDFAERRTLNQRLQDWVVAGVVGLVEQGAAKWPGGRLGAGENV
jgi:hypothetical protein